MCRFVIPALIFLIGASPACFLSCDDNENDPNAPPKVEDKNVVKAPDKVFYVGDQKTELFHRPDCPDVKKIAAKDKLIYPNVWRALDEKLNPHEGPGGCDPLKDRK